MPKIVSPSILALSMVTPLRLTLLRLAEAAVRVPSVERCLAPIPPREKRSF